jgi:phosphoribosylanthranilate isomerase
MIEIKVCGMTNVGDAIAAAGFGADALGFIFHAPSPRGITPERAKEIIAALPERVVRVGVFVNSPAEEVTRIAAFCGLDLLQLHGDETPAYCRRFPPERLIKALSPRAPGDLVALATYPVRAFLIDAREPDRYGGTGKPADWMLAALIARRYPLVLAGGLGEANIGAALEVVAPAAVDLNSGVERAPGLKDHGKLQRTIAIIRAADGRREGDGRAAPPAGPVVFARPACA